MITSTIYGWHLREIENRRWQDCPTCDAKWTRPISARVETSADSRDTHWVVVLWECERAPADSEFDPHCPNWEIKIDAAGDPADPIRVVL